MVVAIAITMVMIVVIAIQWLEVRIFFTPIILTPSIQDPSSSISSSPSAPPAPSSPPPPSALPAPATSYISPTTSPSPHGSTAAHLQSINVRGETIGKGTAIMVAAMGTLKVELDYDIGRLTNDTISSKLTSERGYLVRKHAPLQVESWMKIDKNERKKIRDLQVFLVSFIFQLNTKISSI